MSALPDFYAADRLEQIAINLFYGWGYNFYRLENQLRADDLMLRAKVGALLGAARHAVEAAEGEWRRTRLPPPSREKPRPDPEAVAGAQRLERLSAAIGARAGQISAQPVPEGDRMTQRHRSEAGGLAALLACDRVLAARAELLRTTAEGKDGAWLLANVETLEQGLAALDESLRERSDILNG